MLKIRIIAGLISFLLLVFIFESIRRRKFMEKFALLWICSGLLIFFFSVFPKPLFVGAQMLGLHYLTMLLLIVFSFLLLTVLYFSISLSSLTEKNKDLAQEFSIMKLNLELLRREIKDE